MGSFTYTRRNVLSLKHGAKRLPRNWSKLFGLTPKFPIEELFLVSICLASSDYELIIIFTIPFISNFQLLLGLKCQVVL